MGIEYRKVTPEERMHVSRIQNIVFGGGSRDEQEIREQIERGEYGSENTYGAVDESGRVIAGMDIIPYVMWFDGHKVDMTGIAGVASMPESRRQGNIRGIFEKVFEDIYAQGAVFSHLYPFSYDYYRKFGYEHAGAARRYKLPLEYARKLRNSGTAHEFVKGYGDSDGVRAKLIEIYEAYASRHNMMVSRSDSRWDDVFKIALFGADRLYYWRDAAGEIKSWVKFKKEDDTMQVLDIAWLDNESMLGILQFMGMFDGAADNLKIKASPEFVPDLYWNEVYDIEQERANMGMSCVVNAKRVLELLSKSGEGSFRIKIADDFAGWNNNIYAVEYGGGECAVKTCAGAADIEVSARALTQMALGVFGLEQIINRADVQLNANGQTLAGVFCKKPMLLVDYF